jgi:hypothetical protein
MKMAIALLAASFLIVFAITVKAAKIENLDQAQYQLRIVESGQEHEVALQPAAEAADLCKTKCELYIGADPDPYELVSADALVLGGGRLYENDSKDANPDTSTPKPSTTVAAAKAKPAKKSKGLQGTLGGFNRLLGRGDQERHQRQATCSLPQEMSPCGSQENVC